MLIDFAVEFAMAPKAVWDKTMVVAGADGAELTELA